MEKLVIFIAIFCYSLVSFADDSFNPNDYSSAEKKEMKNALCKKASKTPEEKCRDAKGIWKGTYCLKVKSTTKWRTKWREKECPRCPDCNCPACPEPRVVTVEKPVIQERTVIKKPPEEKWWWIGPGAFALGLYMSEEREFLTGVQGKLAFAINERFRVSGMIGFAFWQNLAWLYGATFDVRAHKGLFVTFSFDSVWGDLNGFSQMRSRSYLAGTGLTYWFGNHADISLRFLLGVKRKVEDCEGLPDYFVGGNVLTVNVYF